MCTVRLTIHERTQLLAGTKINLSDRTVPVGLRSMREYIRHIVGPSSIVGRAKDGLSAYSVIKFGRLDLYAFKLHGAA